MATILYLVVVIIAALGSNVLAVDIKSFQPEILPIQSVTTLNIATAGQLNSSSAIQCRFNDISMPAELKGSVVVCNTPPMRQIDKAVLHLEVDGRLFKAKKQLRFYEPFKAVNISPKLASPTQQLGIKISGITCEKWMTFFVRFQTANGTKKTQKGICENSTVTCYVPVFPAHTLLRVGVTLSNRIVEWSPVKLRIQYPIDSMKSSLEDLQPDTTRSGAFTFHVVLKDKFYNSLTIPDESKTDSTLSVQYSPYARPKDFQFLNCEVSMVTEKTGSKYGVSCDGAKHERILVYPSINNVPVGGKSSYEVKTTLCPGKTSCDDDNSLLIIIVSSTLGTVALLVLAGLYYKHRHAVYRIFFLRHRHSSPDETSLEMNQHQEHQMPSLTSVEDLPATHMNESALSEEKVSKESEDLKEYSNKSETIEREGGSDAIGLKKDDGHEEVNGGKMSESKPITSLPENDPGSHVKEVALSIEEDEDAKEIQQILHGDEFETNLSYQEDGDRKTVGLKDEGLVREGRNEDIELLELKVTSEREVDEKM